MAEVELRGGRLRMQGNRSPWAGDPRWGSRAVLGTTALLLAWLFWRNAWLADDAFITFRSIEQLFAGNGPRWNPHERVQAFTHPLWFWCLAAARVVTRRLDWTSLGLSLLVTATAIFSARFLVARDVKRWLLLVALLISSKAFVDYAWSGLETPLAYLLLVVLLAWWDAARRIERQSSARALAGGTLLLGLLVLTHPDLILIATPPVLAVAWRTVAPRRAMLGAIVAGAAPVWLWATFATFYYGTPLPNTAYAKLNTGIPASELWGQGLLYLLRTLTWDPVTVVVCVAGTMLALRDQRSRPFGVGLALYLAYVTAIGGDFMVGRLFAPAFLVGAVFVVRAIESRTLRGLLFASLVALNLAVRSMPIRLPADYSVANSFDHTASHGIADEKAVYFRERSLRHHVHCPLPVPPLPEGGVVAVGNIGLTGYAAGTERILIDGHGLADPLLARLPASRPWRPGHFWRDPPAGYVESVRDGVNLVRDPNIRRLYADVHIVTQGPLIASGRLRAMIRLALARRPDTQALERE